VARIRSMLGERVNWTLFARTATDHGLAAIAGQTLVRYAPDMVPDDILDALRIVIERTHERNRVLFDELARLIRALANNGIEAIPFRGPTLAIKAFGDLGHRMGRGLSLFVRDDDIPSTMAALVGIGYERAASLSKAEIKTDRLLPTPKVLFNEALGIHISLLTRLTAMNSPPHLDYCGLWRRAERTDFDGTTMLTLAAEDELVLLAIDGSNEMWRSIKSVCDVAAFLTSHPKLEWTAIVERAREQACLQTILLAMSLAHTYFNSSLPASITAAASAGASIEPAVRRVAANWQSKAITENLDGQLKTDAELFNENAGTYGTNPLLHAIPKELEELYRQDLEEVLGAFAEYESVLEVGAGNGIFTRLLDIWGCKGIVGTDISDGMLGVARARLPQCRFEQVMNEAEPNLFPPATFDLVISRQLACHLIDPITVFECWKMWLKPGGRIAVIDGLWTRSDWGPPTGRKASLVEERPLSCTQTSATVSYLLARASLVIRHRGVLKRVNDFAKERYVIGQGREPIVRFVVVATSE
jgi:SAM-dependent methyltransferase